MAPPTQPGEIIAVSLKLTQWITLILIISLGFYRGSIWIATLDNARDYTLVKAFHFTVTLV